MTNTTDQAQADLHAKILKQVNSEIEGNPRSYNTEKYVPGAAVKPYQTYERIGFEGMRWSVEKRIKEYGLEQFFDPEVTVLDIGSNFGFFVCEFALHCKIAHGIEPNPPLNKIGEITAEYLGVSDKVKFHDCFFDKFESDVKYDTIFSLAAFHTADGRERSKANDYFSKINSLLKPNGRVFYESTSHTKPPDSKHFAGFSASKAAIVSLR